MKPGESAEVDGLPGPLTHIVQRCLPDDPQTRWESACEVRALLEWSSQTPKPAVSSRAFPWKWLAVAALLALAVPVALYLRGSPPEPPFSTRFSVPIPGGSPQDVGFELSPDGKNLAITAYQDADRYLWIRPIDSLEARLIPGSKGASGPFWSPDGLEIGFIAGGKISRVRLAGGTPFVISDRGSSVGTSSSWSSRGVILFQGRGTSGLLSVPATGEGAALPIERGALPFFLPDGRHFLYSNGPRPEESGVFVGSLVP